MSRSLSEFELLSFDCYGTLIDWESGIWAALQPLASRAAGDPQRDHWLARFGFHEHRLQRARPDRPYPELLGDVHAALAREFGVGSDAALDRAFGRSVPDWPAFDDSAAALRILQRHYRLVILSNVDRASFAGSAARLGVRFDAVYTAEEIGSYKPDPRNFEYLLEQLRSDFGLGKEAILHTAQSLLHDHVPARAFGLANCWIDRQRLSRGGSWGATAGIAERPEVDFLYFSLGEFAAAAEQAGPR